jgi:hypothetical protein
VQPLTNEGVGAVDEVKLKSVRVAASDFRAAIERCNKKRLGIEFEEFPHGSCGAVAEILGKYLGDCGLGDFRYVSGWRHRPGEDRGRSHAWLRQDGVIVDITADQFGETYGPVVVTTDSSWHDAFGDQHENNAWDERTRMNRHAMLAMVLAQLVRSQPEPG